MPCSSSCGFYSEAAVAAAEQSREGAPAPKIYAATGRQPHGRTVAQLEARDDPPAPGADASAKEIMAHRLATQAGRKLYAQRKQTIEPVFGIIKAAMGFRRFSLRGLAKVRTEWTLVTLAYNLKRLFHGGANLAAAQDRRSGAPSHDTDCRGQQLSGEKRPLTDAPH